MTIFKVKHNLNGKTYGHLRSIKPTLSKPERMKKVNFNLTRGVTMYEMITINVTKAEKLL